MTGEAIDEGRQCSAPRTRPSAVPREVLSWGLAFPGESPMARESDVTNMAVFCDFENVALGVRDASYEKFDIQKVLERLLLKGSIVVKKAYCDWERYKAFKAPMHEASFELIEIPHVRQSGKNSADIRMVVDALDLCYTKAHVDTFVIISGDSDFSPLVSKLRENDKTVIGVGVKNSTSDLLIANCDEFIYYDDLVREQKKRAVKKAPARPGATQPAREPRAARGRPGAKPAAESTNAPAAAAPPAYAGTALSAPDTIYTRAMRANPGLPMIDLADPKLTSEELNRWKTTPDVAAEIRRQEAIDIVVGTTEALAEERGGDKVYGSMVKQALKRVRPGFAESYYGFRSFNAMLEAARDAGALALERDEKSGGYVVRLAAVD
jgi:uncharacterized protein (TIGR00288 family)